jgi:hypothetical protein
MVMLLKHRKVKRGEVLFYTVKYREAGGTA